MAKGDVELCVRFLPKKSFTRPLIVFTGVKSRKRYSVVALKIGSAVITQVCAKRRWSSNVLPYTGAAVWNGTGSFPRRFQKFIQRNHSERIYAVKADVMECFDRINQDILLSVMNKIIMPNEHYQLYAKSFGTDSVKLAQMHCLGCGIACHNQAGKKFVYRDGVYRAYRGIPQGNHASTRLCDLYLGAADCERYSEMMLRRDILLMRYVDDYLLLTTDFSVALKFLEDMHVGVDDGYDIVADSAKTVINFHCGNDKLLGCGKVVGSWCAIPWCGYTLYPGLGKFSIDWPRMQSGKIYSCGNKRKMSAREKRIAVLNFVKASLFEKYKVISQMASSKWKRRVLRKFSALGAKLYARPYARKARLSMKGRWNRVFWGRLRAWIRQGFTYKHNKKLARLYKQKE